MKTLSRLLSAAIVLMAVLTGCEPENGPTPLPTPGLRMDVNGQHWESGHMPFYNSTVNAPSASYYVERNAHDSLIIQLWGVSVNGNDTSFCTMTFLAPAVNTLGTYSKGDYYLNGMSYWPALKVNTFYDNQYFSQDFTVTVTEFDTLNRTISGTFAALTKCAYGCSDTINITNGSFTKVSLVKGPPSRKYGTMTATRNGNPWKARSMSNFPNYKLATTADSSYITIWGHTNTLTPPLHEDRLLMTIACLKGQEVGLHTGTNATLNYNLDITKPGYDYWATSFSINITKFDTAAEELSATFSATVPGAGTSYIFTNGEITNIWEYH